MIPGFDLAAFIAATLAEDMGDAGDITAAAVIPADAVFSGPNHPYTQTLLDATLDPGTTELPSVGDGRPRWRDADGWDDHGDGHRIKRWEAI